MAEKARQPLPWDMRVLVRESGVEMPYRKVIGKALLPLRNQCVADPVESCIGNAWLKLLGFTANQGFFYIILGKPSP